MVKSLIEVDEMQSLILKNLFSDETDKYFSNMNFKDGNCRMAFIQGMVYASILSAVECEKYIVNGDD